MSWKELKNQYSIIINKLKNNENYDYEWANFKKLAFKLEKQQPSSISIIQKSLNSLENSQDREQIKIFDHGCGAALKVVYLATIGYKNVYGVNVNFNVDYVNKLLKERFEIKDNHFFETDGKKVPFPSRFFDFIISSQVLEHLTEKEIYLYYREEGRILKNSGLAYHELPHKFMPYDSHSRFWLIHLFPYFLKPFFYGLFMSIRKKKYLFSNGKYYANYYSKEFLILRTPNFHKKMLLQHIGSFEDLTLKRLITDSDFTSYENKKLLGIRKFIQRLFSFPIIGKLLAIILKNLFILQTLSKKK